MAKPQISKAQLLKHFDNPLLANLFDKTAEKIIKENKDPAGFIAAAKTFNERMKDLEGKNREEFIIGIAKSLANTATQSNDTAKKSHQFDEKRLKELDNASLEEKTNAQKISFIQNLINESQPVTEAFISEQTKSLPDLDRQRVETFRGAADNVTAQAHPQSLMQKILTAIEKHNCTGDKLLSLQAFNDYVKLTNASAEGNSKPFSDSFAEKLNSKADCFQQLVQIEKNLKTFDRFEYEMSQRKKTFSTKPTEPEPETPKRRHTF